MSEPLDAWVSKPLAGGPSFSLSNRLFRLLWMVTWLMTARFTPPMLHGWRRCVLRLFGAQIGRGVRVHASVIIWNPKRLALGEQVLVGPGVRLYNQGRIRIGARTVISQRAHLCASSHDLTDPHFQLVLRPIEIGSDCWVAAEAFVGPGVNMGNGAVLSARGVLFKHADPGGVYSGNPATLLKLRTRLDSNPTSRGPN